MKLKLNNVRLAFPVLFEAKTVNGEGKPAFSASGARSWSRKKVFPTRRGAKSASGRPGSACSKDR